MVSNKSSVTSSSSPRSSENINPMRKSLAANPFSKPSIMTNPRSIFPNTPANSPSGFQRRNSAACRERIGSLQDLDDKENGNNQILKSAKARSPAGSSKGTKNFMSTTISASCKIAESPRKKVLAEMNEHVPSPSAEAKSHFRKVTFSEPLECGVLEERKLDALFDGVSNFEETQSSCLTFEEDLSAENETVHDDANIPLVLKNDTDLSSEVAQYRNSPLVLENDTVVQPDFETISQWPDDGVNLDPTFKLSPTPPPASTTASILALLDDDPLMPPYDPKTNYLSPRPQYLHYKPKPRMELCSECIISASFPDTEGTEDTQSEGSQKESVDVSSDEVVKEEESQISEPTTSPARTYMPDESVESQEVPKRRFSTRSKAFGLILLLSVAFVFIISVTNPPVIDHAVFDDLYEAFEASEYSEISRANFDRFSQLAKANYDGLARNLHIWFTKSLSAMSDLIANVRGLHIHRLAHLQYCNLTVPQDHVVVNQYRVFGPGKNEIGDTPDIYSPALHVQESGAAADICTDENIEDLSAEHYDIYEEQLQDFGVFTVVENASYAPESVEVLNKQAASMDESKQSFQVSEAGNSEAKQEQDYGNMCVENTSELEQAQDGNVDFNFENQQGLGPEASEIHSDVHGTVDLDTKQAQENGGKFYFDEASNSGPKHWATSLDSEHAETRTEIYIDAEGNSLPLDAAVRGNEQGSETTNIPPSMVLYLLLGAGAVVIASAAFNWSKKGKNRSTRVSGDELQALKNKISPEMDMFEEARPSEMSSFQKISSYSKRVEKQLNEGHSQEKKHRSNDNYRTESLASTTSDYSMGSSPSYGSLTMYEKIPNKQGDEAIVTPVRRSSRIRNLATSPI